MVESVFESVYQFRCAGLRFRLTQIGDEQYLDRRQHAMPIAEDVQHLWEVEQALEAVKRWLNLAELYTTLTYLFGPSGEL